MSTEIVLNSLLNSDSKDFLGLVQAFFEYAQNRFPEVWSDFNSDQFMVIIAELIAYTGDLLTYYLDRQTTENFITIARLRQSIIDIATMLDYRLRSAIPSAGQITLSLNPAQFDYGTPIPVGFRVGNGVLTYETIHETTVTASATSVVLDVLEGETYRETLIGSGAVGQSDGTPNQEFLLTQKNIILANNLNDLANDITVVVGGQTYSPLFNLAFAQSTQKAFTLITDDQAQTTLRFGNGTIGIIPPLGDDIEATYRFLLPDRIDNNFGNVNANTITTLIDSRTGITAVTNASAFNGGRAEESVEEARINAPASVKAGDRAVSGSDHVILAKQVPGVAKAAALNNAVSKLNVDLYIAPEGGGNPSTALKNATIVYFEPRRMMRTTVFVRNPIYQPVSINLRIQAEANNRNSDVEAALRTAIKALFSFENLDFNEPVFLKNTGGQTVFDLNDTLESIEGIDNVKYSKVTLKPFAYSQKFTNNGLPLMIGTGSKIRKDALRKEFEASVVSTSEYLLKNKDFGLSTSLNDTRLEDNLKSFLLDSGSTTEVGVNDLTDENQFWVTNQYQGQTVIDHAGISFEIASNSSNKLTLLGGGTPVAGSYQIVRRLVGSLLNPNTTQSLTFKVVSNDANSVSVTSGLSDVAVNGNHYEIYHYETNKYDALAYSGAVTSSPTSTGFHDTGASGFSNSHFNGMYVIFIEGNAANIPSKVTGFVQSGGVFTVNSFGAGIAPSIGDRYVVAPAYRLGLSTKVNTLPSPSTTQFGGVGLGGEGDDYYNGYTIYFTSGALVGLARKVLDYDDITNDVFTVNAFGSAPAINDTFQLTKEYQTDDQTLTFGLLASTPSVSDVYLFQGSPLIGDLTPRENQILTLADEDLVLTVIGGS